MSRKAARFAVEDASARICPVLLHPWCPLPEGGLRIEDCYEGSDCWMGPYFGADAHGGLDINHPAGTHLADGAGVWNGSHEHSHFAFKVIEPGEDDADAIPLDPWILFRQMYQDRRITQAPS